jgi:hypothetical protein
MKQKRYRAYYFRPDTTPRRGPGRYHKSVFDLVKEVASNCNAHGWYLCGVRFDGSPVPVTDVDKFLICAAAYTAIESKARHLKIPMEEALSTVGDFLMPNCDTRPSLKKL